MVLCGLLVIFLSQEGSAGGKEGPASVTGFTQHQSGFPYTFYSCHMGLCGKYVRTCVFVCVYVGGEGLPGPNVNHSVRGWVWSEVNEAKTRVSGNSSRWSF